MLFSFCPTRKHWEVFGFTGLEMSRVRMEVVLGGGVPGWSGGAMGLQEIVLSVAQMMVGWGSLGGSEGLTFLLFLGWSWSWNFGWPRIWCLCCLIGMSKSGDLIWVGSWVVGCCCCRNSGLGQGILGGVFSLWWVAVDECTAWSSQTADSSNRIFSSAAVRRSRRERFS